MSTLRVSCFGLSVDGFGAGPSQDEDNPLGVGGRRAREAAKGADVRLGGGVATIRRYLQARLIDEVHIAITKALLGSGEHLFQGLDLPKLGYHCSQYVTSPQATHVVLSKG